MRKNHGHLIETQQNSDRREWRGDLPNHQRPFAEQLTAAEGQKTQYPAPDLHTLLEILHADTAEAVQIVSAAGVVRYSSPALENFLGYRPEALVGQHVSRFLTEEQRAIFLPTLKEVQLTAKGTKKKEILFHHQKRGMRHFSLTMKNQLHQPLIKGIMIYWKDVTEKVKNREEVEYLVSHDTLTRLPNAISLKTEIRRFCRSLTSFGKGETFALIMLDVNRFKFINDVLGYQQGNQLMVCISERLREFLGDQFLSRYMGDQFAILLQGCSCTEDYDKKVKQLLALFQQPFKVGIYEMDVAVAMGVSIFPSDDQSPDGLINCANIALLRAKHEGKNQYTFYSPNIRVELYRQMSLRNAFYKALGNDEFQVHYQPQVHLGSNKVIAAEALLRWKHADWGMISPEDFIPLAEETGAIIALGKWLLRQVCQHYHGWKAAGRAPGKISVNYSTVQFFEQDFVENVLETIQEYQLSPEFLIMEITESVLMKNAEKVTSDLYRLRELGVQIALDDFGTGFSCLAYLKAFPIDILKIDRLFIQNLFLDSSSRIIIRSVIQMAQDLKIKLVAEGIETEEQLSYLQELSCYAGQGFLYCKPIAENMFSRVLEMGECVPAKFSEGKQQNPFWDRRQFTRIKLPEMFPAEMTIWKGEREYLAKKQIRVGIKNIGTVGLCFSSTIQVPMTKEICLAFTLSFLDKCIKLSGKPMWINGPDGGIYECGVKFSFQSDEEVNDITANLYALCQQFYL